MNNLVIPTVFYSIFNNPANFVFYLFKLGLVAFPIFSISTCIDLLQIGHFRKWKNIKYPVWMSWIIDKRRKHYDKLLDYNTHPQVIVLFIVDIIFLAGFASSFILITNLVLEVFSIELCITYTSVIFFIIIGRKILLKVLLSYEIKKYERMLAKPQ